LDGSRDVPRQEIPRLSAGAAADEVGNVVHHVGETGEGRSSLRDCHLTERRGVAVALKLAGTGGILRLRDDDG